MTRNPVSARFDSSDALPGVVALPVNRDYPDAWSIVAKLNALADHYGRDPEVRRRAERTIGAGLVGDHDQRMQAEAVLRFVRTRMRYVADPVGGEHIYSPLILLDAIQNAGHALGDCDDHCLLLASLLRSLGIPAVIAGAKINGSDRYNHVVVLVPLRGGTFQVDPCLKREGWEVEWPDLLLP